MDAATTRKLNRLRALIGGHTSRAEESEILLILTEASSDELGELLSAIDLARLISSVDNHVDLRGAIKNRTWLFEVLARTRVRDLPVPVRVALVSALQRGRTGIREEVAIADVLVATEAAELTVLKNGVDRGDYHDLRQLVFRDLDDPLQRKRILEHVAREALKAAAHGVKVLSDIDDTLFVNWKDARFPQRTVYPGVLQLYAELVRGPDDAGAGSLTFLTARPEDRWGFVEEHSRRSLAGRGLTMEFAILCGDFRALWNDDVIADKKFDNFVQYRQLFPEYGFVFVGDSGQGDAIAGRKMLAHAPDAVRAVFIHDVVATPQEVREAQPAGLVLFDTYAGAALAACHAGLVSGAGVWRVLEAAQRQLAAVDFDTAAQRAAREVELARDAARIAAAVPRPGGGDPGPDGEPPKARGASA